MSEEGGFIDVESDEVPELGEEATATSSGLNSNDHLVRREGGREREGERGREREREIRGGREGEFWGK